MAEHRDSLDYRRVEKAIRLLEDRFREQPTLEDLADHLKLSPCHVQRLFKRWAGVSPKRFLQYVTLEHAKRLLRGSDTVLQASWGAGLSGPGRLHDLAVTLEGVTPGELRSGGEGVSLRWGIHPTPFGPAFLAVTERGVTSLAFVPSEGPEPLIESLGRSWPGSRLREAPEETGPVARRIFGSSDEATSLARSPLLEPRPNGGPTALRLRVQGTNFQIRVWEALLRIPPGTAVTYGDLTTALDRPGAARAVGNAVGRNPVAVLIPCHRVLRRSGEFGGYRWGTARKKALLAWESARLAEGGEEASA